MNELTRANKITAYWEGNGVAVAVFYKTHSKIKSVNSNDEAVTKAGFVMPEGTTEAPITASQKLEAFKNFICANASVFGITYDPVDRRSDDFKFPSHYDETSVMEYSKKMLSSAIEGVLKSLQTNIIDKMAKDGKLSATANVQYGIGDGKLNTTEKYGNGFLKYATVEYPVAFAVDGKQTQKNITVDLVSGQIKKPRAIGDTVLTMTGVKDLLVEAGILPKSEPKPKAEKKDTDATADTAEPAATDTASK